MSTKHTAFRVVKFKERDGTDGLNLLGPQGVVLPFQKWAVHHSLSENKKLNSVRSFAYDLKHWFTWLHITGRVWDGVKSESLADFVSWLRFGEQISNRVIPIAPTQIREETTISRVLSSVYGFYAFHMETPMAKSIRDYGNSAQSARYAIYFKRTALKPVIGKKKSPSQPKSLSRDELNRIIAACDTKRDRLLITLLGERGMRVGQALGLRHSDIKSREATYTIEPRNDNVNGVFAKTDRKWALPLRKDMVRLLGEYMYEEYLDLDCDYLFVSMHGKNKGQPMTYGAADKLRQKLVRKTGIKFNLHMLRHTFATLAISDGVPIAVVQFMLTHKDSSTTTGIYTHLEAETMRKYLDGTDVDASDSKRSFVDVNSIAEIRQQLDGGLNRVQ